MDQPTVALVFGTLGAICWSVQLLPQVVLNYRRHSASGLSAGFLLFWAWAGVPLGVYNIVLAFNYALWVQPQILTALSLITWGQCYYYERKWSTAHVAAVVLAAACFMGGVEAGLIFALRVGIDNGVHWPLTLMAVLAAVLLALGVLEQYLAIWKNKSVHGISFLFCGIDALGDVTSIISVVFEPKLEVMGLVMYGVEFVLWCGIFACGFYFRVLPILRNLRSTRTGRDEAQDGEHHPADGLALHDMPSSTSVFRTVSLEETRRRQRRGSNTSD
ncbi:hypothetical protein LTR09_003586 [Extremus antarcticus]|uniref:PQ loop repeat protein n=1 Tax=Extremus antarcticus TaxID=702011 RepID=A0AAJ0DSN0_9PEZI|nr:hypothetical protein LTR09_003586 [Extremus antarcticus]